MKHQECLAYIGLWDYADQSRAFFPSRFVCARAFTPKQKNAARRRNNNSAMIGIYVIHVLITTP